MWERNYSRNASRRSVLHIHNVSPSCLSLGIVQIHRSSINNFSRCVVGDSVMEFILYCCKKLFRNGAVCIIVSTALGVNACDLLIEAFSL